MPQDPLKLSVNESLESHRTILTADVDLRIITSGEYGEYGVLEEFVRQVVDRMTTLWIERYGVELLQELSPGAIRNVIEQRVAVRVLSVVSSKPSQELSSAEAEHELAKAMYQKAKTL